MRRCSWKAARGPAGLDPELVVVDRRRRRARLAAGVERHAADGRDVRADLPPAAGGRRGECGAARRCHRSGTAHVRGPSAATGGRIAGPGRRPGRVRSFLGCDDDTTTADSETSPDAGPGGSEAPPTSSDGPMPDGPPDSSESSGPPMEDSGLGSRGCACGVEGAPARLRSGCSRWSVSRSDAGAIPVKMPVISPSDGWPAHVGFRRDCDSVAEARTPVTWPSDTPA